MLYATDRGATLEDVFGLSHSPYTSATSQQCRPQATPHPQLMYVLSHPHIQWTQTPTPRMPCHPPRPFSCFAVVGPSDRRHPESILEDAVVAGFDTSLLVRAPETADPAESLRSDGTPVDEGLPAGDRPVALAGMFFEVVPAARQPGLPLKDDRRVRPGAGFRPELSLEGERSVRVGPGAGGADCAGGIGGVACVGLPGPEVDLLREFEEAREALVSIGAIEDGVEAFPDAGDGGSPGVGEKVDSDEEDAAAIERLLEEGS